MFLFGGLQLPCLLTIHTNWSMFGVVHNSMVQWHTVLYCTVLKWVLENDYCTVLYTSVPYCTVLYHTVLYSTVPYCTVQYCTILYSTVTSLSDTHLLIKLYAWSFRQKVLWWVGGIAIIASSSRSRSDFKRDLEVEIEIDLEIDFWPGPELDNNSKCKVFVLTLFIFMILFNLK